MRDYLALQFRLINRHLRDFGLQPAIGYLLIGILFSGFTGYLFYMTPYAGYVYPLIGIGGVSLLSESGRTGFLRQYFSRTDFMMIRCLENIIIALPFIIGLCVYHQWWMAIALVAITMLLALVSVDRKINMVIPTPFGRYPFEFTIGFRKNYPVILLAGFLLTMAVIYDNANLGLFAVALVLLVSLVFYMQSETTYLVWIHAMSPQTFLLHKVVLAIVYATLLCLPFAVVMLMVYSSYASYLAIVYLVGMLYLVTTVLSKYAFFPAPMNVPQGLLMAFSFSFPPMLLFLLPYFYKRSVHQLKPVLQ